MSDAAWDGSKVELQRLDPSLITGLPLAICDWMSSHGYTIPQSYCGTGPHNAFPASLSHAESCDWAILCSRADSSRIIVFWNGSPDSITALENRADRGFAYVCDKKLFGYTRGIGPVDPKRIIDMNPTTVMSAAVDHHGVEEWACQKGSLVLFWEFGRLSILSGVD